MARQATLKEVTDGRKKKGAKNARRKHVKEMENARWVWAGKNQNDIETELESEEATEMGGDASSSENEGGREVIATSVERHEPTAASVHGGREAERRGDVPVSRKRAMSSDATVERGAKRTQSPRPSEASPASPSPAPSMAGQASRSEEWARTPASLGPAPACDLQQGDTPPAAPSSVS